MLRFHSASMGLVLAGVLLATNVKAETVDIPVPNGDFSLPALSSNPGYKYEVPESWTATMPTQVGVSLFGAMTGSGQFLYHDLFVGQTCYLYQENIGTSFVQGDTYTLGFDYANGQTNPCTIRANLCYNAGNSAVAAKDFELAASQGWTHGSVSGIATGEIAGPISIVFAFTTPAVNASYQAFLDNVTITRTSSVPEPAGMTLVVTSILAAAAYAWRKRG